MTASGKRFLLPAIIISVLVFLLVLIGWLAYLFFDGLARRTVPVEPFFGVSTSVVQHASPPPRTHTRIVLPPAGTPSTGEISVPPLPEMRLDAVAPPAACVNYEETITQRPAWHNPLEYTASIRPDRVRILVHTPPAETGEEQP